MEFRQHLPARRLIMSHFFHSYYSTCNRTLSQRMVHHRHHHLHQRWQFHFPSRPARRPFACCSAPRPQSRPRASQQHPLRPQIQTQTQTQTQNHARARIRVRSYHHHHHHRPYSSSSQSPATHATPPQPQQSLSTRLRSLSREYGWSALGVYLLLSAIDFPFCYLAVHMLGTERIGHWERVVVDAFAGVVGLVGRRVGRDRRDDDDADGDFGGGDGAAKAASVTASPAEAEAESITANRHENRTVTSTTSNPADNVEKATIYTQLALAYALHKSLIFFRVPLTAAVTPKVVRSLRAWGWDIGKKMPKKPKKPKKPMLETKSKM